MSRIFGADSASSKAQYTQPKGNSLESLDQDKFLSLILTELQNQDPMAPTDNAALIEQMSQLRSISANDQLMNALGNFSVTQELTTASNLIGRKVEGLDTAGDAVEGVVSSVSVEVDGNDRNKRGIRVHVGDQVVDIKNIREIVPVE